MSVCIRYYQIALLKNQFILITKGVKEEEDLLGCLNRKKKKKNCIQVVLSKFRSLALVFSLCLESLTSVIPTASHPHQTHVGAGSGKR